MPETIAIGTRMAIARESAGLTQAGLAGRMGVKQSYIADVERGRRNPSSKWLTRAARAIGCPASDPDERLCQVRVTHRAWVCSNSTLLPTVGNVLLPMMHA